MLNAESGTKILENDPIPIPDLDNQISGKRSEKIRLCTMDTCENVPFNRIVPVV